MRQVSGAYKNAGVLDSLECTKENSRRRWNSRMHWCSPLMMADAGVSVEDLLLVEPRAATYPRLWKTLLQGRETTELNTSLERKAAISKSSGCSRTTRKDRKKSGKTAVGITVPANWAMGSENKRRLSSEKLLDWFQGMSPSRRGQPIGKWDKARQKGKWKLLRSPTFEKEMKRKSVFWKAG